ncbi:MAG TPA: SIMPL domain-containing protein [Fimbriimonas sp.]|nr:SIMPL domain-containing protein [Fimbriimonas sp.]
MGIWRGIACGAVAAVAAVSSAQIAGGAVYGQRQGGPEDFLRQERNLSDQEVPPTLNSVFLDASVMINIHADTYVAVFGISEEGKTLADARAKVHEKLAAFKTSLHQAGVKENRISADFVSQNRIYEFQVDRQVATERVVGFELKENLSVKCRSQAEVDSLIALAAKDNIFDLIKVDYVLSDLSTIKARLMEAAGQVIAQKRKDYRRLFGVGFRTAPQIYADKFNVFYPTEMYNSYQAAEGDNVNPGWNMQNYVIHGARKMRTFYYNAIPAKSFDKVVNPVVTDPVVQGALYLKLRYESGGDNRLITRQPK